MKKKKISKYLYVALFITTLVLNSTFSSESQISNNTVGNYTTLKTELPFEH